ncbi:hypothetical protein ACFQVD_32425 [Streptosporangium amethystogenes subsp. fukuiense]|uniref:Uncharacterized protein n=2 Tax=Streptosporangium TaxID=2000 RepID=A0ABW2T828_9ACTN
MTGYGAAENNYGSGAAMTTYTLSIVEGDTGGLPSGQDLFSPDCPVNFSDLGPYALMWLTEHGYREQGRRVLVTPAGRHPEGVHVIASHDVDL